MKNFILGVLCTLLLLAVGGLGYSLLGFAQVRGPTAGTEYTEARVFWVAKHGVRRSGMFANDL
jgi:hypothetical protein